MKRLIFLSLCFCVLLAGCESKPTLQKYFVENTENKNFMAFDLSPTILNIKETKLSAEQKQALQSFDKMNILAFKVNEQNKAQFETECDKVKTLLKDEQYQQLMKYGSGSEGASVSFVGDDEHIDEFVLFANRKDSGFAVIRILGDDMNPTGILEMMSILKTSDINLEQLKPLQEMLAK
jgi:Domain of unknown function (DUF4252)